MLRWTLLVCHVFGIYKNSVVGSNHFFRLIAITTYTYFHTVTDPDFISVIHECPDQSNNEKDGAASNDCDCNDTI
jgi:hypothetical protein